MSWATAWDVVSAVSKVASAGAQVYGAYQQAEAAKDIQKMQEAEYRRVRQLEAARAKQQARIQKAQMYHQQATSGAMLSTTASGIVGIGSSLESGLTDLSQRTSFNIGSTEMQRDASVSKAIGAGIEGVASFAAVDYQVFTDILKPISTTENKVSQPTHQYGR